MATLATVGDYITEARRLLQDQTVPYRYPDADLISALNLGVLECRRLRPDLFLSAPSTPLSDPPSFTVSGTTVSIDVQYRTALVFYVTGFVGIRDAEESSDARAATFMGMFRSLLGTGNLA
jgi:hypothetical protein